MNKKALTEEQKNILNKKYNFLRPIKNDNLVRLGRNKDGGYVVDSNIINDCQILITLGLGLDWSFEMDFLERKKNLSIIVYDHTVSSLPYLKNILKYLRRFLTFRCSFEALKTRLRNYKEYKNFLSLDSVKFYREKITHPAKNKIESDIKKIFSRINDDIEVMLKIDIESSEYYLIDQILKYSNRVKMLIIEFHWIDENEDLFIDSVKKLNTKFGIIHIHGNNHFQMLKNGLPVVLEITLLNNKFISNKFEHVNNFPIKDLDFPNNPFLKDISFSFQD